MKSKNKVNTVLLFSTLATVGGVSAGPQVTVNLKMKPMKMPFMCVEVAVMN